MIFKRYDKSLIDGGVAIDGGVGRGVEGGGVGYDWSVLGFRGDPTPGDPARVTALAQRLTRGAEQVERNTGRLRGISAGGGDLRLEGDYAAGFLSALAELPDELSRLGRAYRGCAQALSHYSGELDQAKQRSQTAIQQGTDAHWRFVGAQREIRSLVPADLYALGSEQVVRNVGHQEAMLAKLTDESVKAQVRHALQRARYADSDRSRAASLAQQAAQLRGEAETRAVNAINAALNESGMRNESWWKKAWDFVSAPFRSWDSFIELLKVVALVVGILAMIIGGPILGIIALVVGLIILADVLWKYSQGKASLFDVGMELLGVLPFGRGLAALGRLGMVARTMAPVLRVTGKLRNLTTAFPHGLNIAGGLRGALRNPRLFGRAFKCRFVGRDPIDMASGEMVLAQTDLTLPGLLELSIQRTHTSSYTVGRLFGPAWSSPLDQRLEVDDSGVYYASVDGVLQQFPYPLDGQTVTALEGPRFELRRDSDEAFLITDPDTGQTLTFAEIPGAAVGMFLLVRIADRNNNDITLHYGARAELTELRHSGGYHVEATTEDGLLTALRLRDGDTSRELVRYGYNPAGMLTDIINSSGRPLRFTYDEHGRIIRWTDRNNTYYAYTFDDHGRVVATHGSANILNGQIHYDVENRITTETNSLGHRTQYHYNQELQIERVTNPLGHTTHQTWDRYDNILTSTNPLGHTTTYEYDDAGNLVRIGFPDETESTVVFNALRLPLTVTGADGATWVNEYDEFGNLTAVTDPMAARTTMSYNEFGALVASTNPLGQVTTVVPDAAGLPLVVANPNGSSTRMTRDAFGRVQTLTDAVGNVTHFTWTTEGRIAARTEPDGATQRWIYDAEGNLVEVVDATGAVRRYAMSEFDQVGSRTEPDGSRFTFTRDTELRLIAVTNPHGLMWRYEYDPAGNLIRETDFNDRTVTYAYDAAGRLATRTSGSGETSIIRDAMGNAVQRSVGGVATTFRYDALGRLIGAANPDATLTWERDALGRVVAETCNGRTVTSAYNALSQRVSRTTPSGVHSAWEYATSGVPAALHAAGQTVRFEHDAARRETSRTFGADLKLSSSWDANSRLIAQTITAQSDRLVNHRAFTYRADGAITAIHDHLAGVRSFDLDPLGRVTAVHAHNWTEQYRYDVAGNLIEATWPAPAESDAAEAVGARQYAGTRVVCAGRVRYEHDAQGRVTLRQRKQTSARPQTWRYTWTAEDRLASVTTPDGQHWTYQYDPLGRRIRKIRVNPDGSVAEQTTFSWDDYTLAEQATTSGQITTWEWQPGSFRPVAQVNRDQAEVDARFYAIVTDLIGTPTELLDTDGAIAWQTRTTLWGLPAANSPATVDCPLRFPGQYHDPESQLNYNYHRYYDPDTARYTSSDPLGFNGGENPHAYVPNPTTWQDPYGLAAGPYGGIHVSVKAPDWITKRGAHIHIGNPPREVRIFPDGNGGIGAEPIRLRSGVPTPQQVQRVLDELASNPQLREDVIRVSREVMDEMNRAAAAVARGESAGEWAASANHALQLQFLIKALEKMG